MKRPRKRASSVAVIDIGSNSVRLVVYELMARSLITIFNEKALCGLGREVQTTGLAGAGCRRQGPDLAAAVSRAVPGDEGRPRPCDRHRRLSRRQQRPRLHRQSRTHLRLSDRDPVGSARGAVVRAGRGFRHPQPGRHRRRSRRRFAGTDRRARQPRSPRRDAPARKPGAAGRLAQVAEARRAHRQDRSFRRRTAQGRPRPHLLCGRRNVAGAGPHPHHPERLSFAGDARLFDCGGGCARFRAAAAPSGGSQHAGQYRGRRRRPPAAADLCGPRSRIHHSRRQTEDYRVLDLRRARGPALRQAAAGRALQGWT